MARNFDGTDDNVDFGSDASVDNFTVKSIGCYIYISTPSSNYDGFVTKNGADDQGWQWAYSTFSNNLQFYQKFSTTSGQWTTTPGTGQWVHLGLVYDKSSASNDPSIWHNGTAQTPTEATTPSGTAADDSAHPLRLGELGSGTIDAQGKIVALLYHNAALTAADWNRARWWGRPFGGLAVYQPLFTSKLANEGTATAAGTATGSTMTDSPIPVQRPGSACMGMGCGW